MNEYFGIFQEIRSLLDKKIEEYGIYEDVFSKVYSDLGAVNIEVEYYAENAYCTGKNILEIACGDGKNYMIPLARKGFMVDGVEISKSMIERFYENISCLPDRIKSRLKIIECNIFEYIPDKKYDLIIIPSTTICLLADNMEKTKSLFLNISNWLNKGGRVMFDYRRDQVLGSRYETEIMARCSLNKNYFFLMQEFVNYIPGRAIVNMYIESYSENKERKCIASSNKKVITDQFVDEIIANTYFKVHNKYDIKLQNAEIRLLVLEKIGER